MPSKLPRPLLPLLLAASGLAVAAEKPVALDTVEVVAPNPRSALGLPAAVDRIDAAELREGQLQLDLSESLQRVPGLDPRNRQNFAQDSQLQSRGFGARASFGVRGLQLRLDGAPLGSPDGQGQTGTVAIGALDRIEVLRGPLAYRYGNAAGGVLALHSAEPAPDGRYGVDAIAGAHDTARLALYASAPLSRRSSLRVDAQHLETGGSRPHSAARREQVLVRSASDFGDGRELLVTLGLFDQPLAEDPLGLTRAQFDADPRQAAPAALLFDTRKRAQERQGSLRWSQPLADGRTRIEALAFFAQRGIEQFLSVPRAAQSAPGSAGGVVATERDLFGGELSLSHDFGPMTLQGGLQWQRLDEARQGFENFVGDTLGVKGALRRDEDNRLANFDQFLLLDWPFAPRWELLAAVRHNRLTLRSQDRYQAAGNGDDSGRLGFESTRPALGISYAVGPASSVYASAGLGFETPTLTELAYRPDGSAGFNASLEASRSRSLELGYKRRLAPGRLLSLAVYDIRAEDEIVPATNSGGRASFQNADTERRGVELGFDARFGSDWSARLAADWIRARFSESYRTSSQGQTNVVAEGNRVPGVPRLGAFLELAWRKELPGASAALELRHLGSVAVNDLNSDRAAAYTLLNAWAGWRWADGWRLFLRADNLADRDYAGSVIVNEANGRFFETGAGRSLYAGLRYDGRIAPLD